jgi:hypothetical protein
MNGSDILRHRLINQQIVQTKFKTPEELVTWMGAIQAQDYGMAKWAIGLRLQELKDSDVEKAFNEGKILRTHVLRPTWHFVMPEDIRWMVELTGPRILRSVAHNYRSFGWDKKIFNRTRKSLEKALHGGNQLTRDEIRLVFQKARIATDDLRFIHLMLYAELDGIVCNGARKGNQFTYCLLDERVPREKAKALNREEALTELAKRYFTSHGPATVQDFAWWSGLSISEAKRGIDTVGKKLRKEISEGKEYFFMLSDLTLIVTDNKTQLLPNFDEYTVGYSDRNILFDKKHSADIATGTRALGNSILINGKLEGSWKRTIKDNSVVVEAKYFCPLSKAKERMVMRAMKKYGEFIGKSLKT